MAYVEPQYNAAQPAPAVKGVWMTGEGKEAGLRIGDAQPSGVPASEGPQPQDDATVARAGETCPPKVRVALSELTRNRLAVQLRAMYDTVAQQPVPDRFADLIARLDIARCDGSEREKP